MNAHQRLWIQLAGMLPSAQYDQLLAQHKQDLARDQHATKYRTYLRYQREALATIAMCNLEPLMEGHKLKWRAEERLQRVRAWLREHEDWNPDTRTGGCSLHPPAVDSTR